MSAYRWIALATMGAFWVAFAACSGQGTLLSSLSGTGARSPGASAAIGAETQCRVNAVRICEQAAHDRPASFFPDAVKGRSAQNPSNLMAFATPFQIPGGAQLKVACYYRPGTMKVIYARAWIRTGHDDFVDLDPQAGQVLNYGAPSGPPLDRRSLDYLVSHGYCLSAQP